MRHDLALPLVLVKALVELCALRIEGKWVTVDPILDEEVAGYHATCIIADGFMGSFLALEQQVTLDVAVIFFLDSQVFKYRQTVRLPVAESPS